MVINNSTNGRNSRNSLDFSDGRILLFRLILSEYTIILVVTICSSLGHHEHHDSTVMPNRSLCVDNCFR